MKLNTAQLLDQLKWEFYEWCGCLSLDEIASNSKLIRMIEQVERLLITQLEEI